MILLLIYIVTIFFAKDYFSIQEIGTFFIFIGFTWLILQRKSLTYKVVFQPIILIIIGFASFLVNDILVLKSFPLILSMFFFLAFIYAHISKKFFLLEYISKFKKISNSERDYLEKTHLIWIIVTLINVLLHSYFLFYATIEMWTFYTTVGWYILLGVAILFQILFRSFYEKKVN